MACACCSWDTSPGTSRFSSTSRKASGSTGPASSPKTAGISASPSTAPLSSACPARPRRRSRKRSVFAKEINPHSLQVSIAAPYPGTALYRQARENGWLPENDAALIDERGVQAAALSYPNLNRTEIYDSVESFYRQFYFRAGKIAEMSAEMLRSPGMMRRRLREGAEFISFLRRRDSSAS